MGKQPATKAAEMKQPRAQISNALLINEKLRVWKTKPLSWALFWGRDRTVADKVRFFLTHAIGQRENKTAWVYLLMGVAVHF